MGRVGKFLEVNLRSLCKHFGECVLSVLGGKTILLRHKYTLPDTVP